jgi:hypothetical protein
LFSFHWYLASNQHTRFGVSRGADAMPKAKSDKVAQLYLVNFLSILWKNRVKFDKIVTIVVEAMQLLGYYLIQSVTKSNDSSQGSNATMSLITLKSSCVLATILATVSTAFAAASPVMRPSTMPQHQVASASPATPLPGGGPHVAALTSPATPLPGGGPHVAALTSPATPLPGGGPHFAA